MSTVDYRCVNCGAIFLTEEDLSEHECLFDFSTREPQVDRIARSLSDGARRVLRELVEQCPGKFDTTGSTKLRANRRTVCRHLPVLESAGLVARLQTQERLALYPTPLARAIHAVLLEG